MDWFKCDRQRDFAIGADNHHLVNLRPSRSVIAAILLPFGSSLRLSNYRRRLESAPGLCRSGSPHSFAAGGNRTPLPASATNELVELETARVSTFWAEHLAI
jgi:hypothetical protein